jgi:hypothetical protein
MGILLNIAWKVDDLLARVQSRFVIVPCLSRAFRQRSRAVDAVLPRFGDIDQPGDADPRQHLGC